MKKKKWSVLVLFCLVVIIISITVLQIAPSLSLRENTVQDDQMHIVALQGSLLGYNIQPRAFHRWNFGKLPLPCPPFEMKDFSIRLHKTPSRTGFLFVKPEKCGSSTAAGVTLRIASRVAQSRSTKSTFCKNRVRHGRAGRSMKIAFRDRKESILWSLVRDPTRRAISQFFHFAVSRGRRSPTDENFQKYLKNQRNLQDFLVMYLYPDPLYRTAHPISTTIHRILESYDFIGVTERMDESLVALQLILGLETEDIVHISSKQSGGFDDGLGTRDGSCTFIQPSFVSEGMREFFDSPYWRSVTRNDMLLHQAVNQSLDLTIHHLGRDVFDEALQKFRRLQAQANHACDGQVRMPCDSNGTKHILNDCIFGDVGCGFGCIDRALDNARLEK